jgi:hypothetical protein
MTREEAIEKAMDNFANLLEIEWDGTLEGSDLKADFVETLSTVYDSALKEAAKVCEERGVICDNDTCHDGDAGAIRKLINSP